MAARSTPASEPGFRGPTVIALARITYRQLDYWARTGLVTPSVRAADGSGTQRLYSFTDIVELRIIKRLLDAGVSLSKIRKAIGYLRRESGGKPLTDVTLMSDGDRIYACHSGEEVVDALNHGQAVFGIAVGRVWADTEGDLAHLPGDQRVAGEVVAREEAEAAEPEADVGEVAVAEAAVAESGGAVPARPASQGNQG
jgi:DNA-binding transcriptional MerR regulator